jgi:hypothetical protein
MKRKSPGKAQKYSIKNDKDKSVKSYGILQNDKEKSVKISGIPQVEQKLLAQGY